jgi:hypothetical protein
MKPKMSATIDDLCSRPVHTFDYKGFKIEIYANGVFTAFIIDPRPGMVPEISWSLNTFNPETLGDAVRGAKHIIDHPPEWPTEKRPARKARRAATVKA